MEHITTAGATLLPGIVSILHDYCELFAILGLQDLTDVVAAWSGNIEVRIVKSYAELLAQ